jgi:hypothetical protein
MGMGSPEEGLQAIEGITQDYYTKYGDMQAFVQEMNQVGIDVTNPDNRNQEERDAANLYRKMLADIRYKGEELKNSQKMLEKFAGAKLSSFGADIKYRGDQNKPFDIYQAEHTGMTSAEKDAAIGGRLDQQIDATAANTESQIQARATQGELNRRVQLQIAQIRSDKAAKTLETKTAPYAPIHADFINLASGLGEWTQSNVLSETGVPMLEMSFRGGSKLGSYNKEIEKTNSKGEVTGTSTRVEPRVIKGGLRDTETGKIYIEFEGKAGMMEITPDNADGLVPQYAESNPGYRSSDANAYLSMLEKSDNVEVAELSPELVAQSADVVKKAEKDLATIDDMNRVGSGKEFKLPDGTVLTVDKEGTGFMNLWSSHRRILGGEAYGLDPEKKYTPSEVVDILHQLGYYNQGKKNAPIGTKVDTPIVQIDTSAVDAGVQFNVPK